MKKLFGIVFIVIGIFIVFVTVKGSALFETAEKTSAKEKNIPLTDVKAISVETTSLDIYIHETDKDELTIALEGVSAKRANMNSETKADGQVIVEAKTVQRFGIGFNFYRSAKLHVYLPSSYENDLSIQTSSGDVIVNHESHFSELNIVTSSGDVNIVSGEFAQLQYRSSSGDFKASNLVVEEAMFQTNSGDIVVKSFQGKLQASTSSGDALIEYAQANDELRWNSQSGDLLVYIPEPSFMLDFSTSSGDLVVAKKHEALLSEKRRYQAKVGEAQKQFFIKTSSGDVLIKS